MTSIVTKGGAAPKRDSKAAAAILAGAAAKNAGKRTMLGIDLKRRIVGTVNAFGHGLRIEVIFRGTRAYTNGKRIVLPAIRDLAEIPYETARALIGYAIHEIGHIRYTDFGEVVRAHDGGKLVKKFQNCIEDYRIEGRLKQAFPGSAPDLTALRIRIHPKLSKLTTGWLADPRACGPLSLTWTGADLNGFANPHVQRTYDAINPAVMALIRNWTDRMEDVSSTAEATDLAIVFADEAIRYAERTLSPDRSKQKEQEAEKQEAEKQDPLESERDDEPSEAEEAEDEAPVESSPDDVENPEDSDASEEEEIDVPSMLDDDDSEADAEDADRTDHDEDGNGDVQDDDSNQSDQASSDDPSDEDEDAGDVQEDAEPSAPDETADEPREKRIEDENEGDPLPGDRVDPKGGDRESADADASDAPVHEDVEDEGEGKLIEGDEAAPSDDVPEREESTSEDPEHPDQSGVPEDDHEAEDLSSPREGSADEVRDVHDDMQDDPVEPDGQAKPKEDEDPFASVLDERAAFDDFLDDIAEAIREAGALPQEEPEASEGEVDPTEVVDDVAQANESAPDYDSDAAGGYDDGDEDQPTQPSPEYDDSRFREIDQYPSALGEYGEMRRVAGGAISTTARVIKRLLMSEEKRIVMTNRRSGEFDIRNMSSIIRGTGNCYRSVRETHSNRTLLATLVDFSGSMQQDMSRPFGFQGDAGPMPITLAMTGALAIEEATRGTSIDTLLYGYTGYSPHVHLYEFNGGRQADQRTKRMIGSYKTCPMNCTPTGEAMAALALRMDEATQERRVMTILTDGTADDQNLCREVSNLLLRRGIEVVAIGIKCDAVAQWAPSYHVINDISQLPQALLATIDPRKAKRLKRRAA